MRHRILIIKLAALGDIAATARAFIDIFGIPPKTLEFHWILERSYIPLAKGLLSALGVEDFIFHSYDTRSLFQGNLCSKILSTARLLKLCRSIQARHVLLLHRDQRYKWALRLAGISTSGNVVSSSENETLLYQKAFHNLKNTLLREGEGFSNETTSAIFSGEPVFETNHIGLFIGGGKNTRGSYLEKRWPYFSELIDLILNKTNFSISLFGGPEDTQEAEDIFLKIEDNHLRSRIKNKVGKISLAELPIALKKIETFVGIDSGISHIAASVMTHPKQRIIALYGPTSPHLWGPLSRGEGKVELVYKHLSCSPCYMNDGKFRPCKFEGLEFQKCMKEISTFEIFQYLTR